MGGQALKTVRSRRAYFPFRSCISPRPHVEAKPIGKIKAQNYPRCTFGNSQPTHYGLTLFAVANPCVIFPTRIVLKKRRQKMFMNAMMGAAVISMNNARARKNANEWMAYAQRLERDIRVHKANRTGQKAIKDAALKELARLDPKNYLLIQENRSRIFDAAANPVLEGRAE